MHISFVERRELSPGVWEFVFQPEQPVEYTPGQYARFTFPFHIQDPHGKQHRTFSFTSHPSDAKLRTLIRFDEPLSLYKEQLLQLQPGDSMNIDEPHGDAILPRLSTTPLVFVAQGIAIASYISMLQEVAASQLPHRIDLFWTKRPADQPLEALVPQTVHLNSRTDVVYPDRLTVDHILPTVADESLLYLSGGQQFVETLGDALEASGIPRERIIYDYYEGYTDL